MSDKSVKLNLINKSDDLSGSEFVIFQKEGPASADPPSIAWLVVKNLAQNDMHPFEFEYNIGISYMGSDGNVVPKWDDALGNEYMAIQDQSGDKMVMSGKAPHSFQTVLLNDWTSGTIDALVFRSGQLVARKNGIAPQQKAVFEFKPTIYIGAVNQVNQGQEMNSAIVSTINTEISLLGIQSADIVITGGGAGPSAQPFAFVLENIVRS